MKQYLKRSAALCMAILLTLSLCVQGVYAMEPDADTIADAQQQETTDAALPEPDAAGDTDSAAVEPAEDAVSSAPDDVTAETAAQVSYAVVNTPELATPGTQEILVGIGDENTAIEQAVLTVRNQETGETASYEAAQLTGGAALFRMDYTDEQTGTYSLDAISYTCSGVETQLQFADIGINAVYGVNTAVSTDPDAVASETTSTEDSAEADVVFDVEKLDNGGESELAGDVSAALNAADAENSSSTQSLDAAENEISTYAAQSTGNVIVTIDPGHDGTHNGAQNKSAGLAEEKLTMRIAQYCKEELEQYAGVTVLMSHDTIDCPYPGTSSSECNAKRVEAAKAAGSSYFVAIHLNSSDSSSANGAEVYYPNENYRPDIGAEGKGLATSIENQLVGLGLKNRGVKIRNSEDGTLYSDGSSADYYGIIKRCKEAGITGIIVEHAFLTNESDIQNFLSTDAGLKKLGVADATGIADYLGLQKGPQKPTTVYNGVDYSAVYNFDYYIERYADLKKAYGNNPQGALQHFVTYGMNEGRQASADFDVNSYYNQYQDLRRAFGRNWKSYYLHYVNYGAKEGRAGTGCTSLRNPITSLDGTNYAAVYDYDYYMEHNSQAAAKCKGDDLAALQYFVSTGMKQGDQASASFDPQSYFNRYADLRRAFGTNWSSYYIHYINFGVKENRSAVDCPEMKNALTVLNGTDYAAVYDYNYYIQKYADIKAAYGNNETAVLQHFVTYGMKEGRRASADFDVSYYRSRYADLDRAFGDDLKQYYIHYMNYGVNEGRLGAEPIAPDPEPSEQHAIMGANSVTVTQMTELFSKKNSSFNTELYGMSLQDFFQLYYDECSAEGVDVQVAFAQAMYETGWLKYGGQVTADQLNFCGLKNTDGSAFATFSTVQEGIRAHVQHLKAYASTDELKNECVDPRFKWIERGCAPYVEDLDGHWTSDTGYSSKILSIMDQF